MSSPHIILLRAINVGGTGKMSMKDLKAALEAAGFSNVRTYINSGNALFDADGTDAEVRMAVADALYKKFKKDFGFVVRTAKDVAAIVKKIPVEWTNDADQKTDVIFLWPEVDNKESVGEIKTKPGIDTLLHHNGTVVWNIQRKNYGKSKMNDFIGTRVYKAMTARNVNTVRKLAELGAEKV